MGERGLKTWEVVPILKPEVMGDGEGPWIPRPEDIWVVQAEEMREERMTINGTLSTLYQVATIQFLVGGKPVVIIPIEHVWRAYEQGSLELLGVLREMEGQHVEGWSSVNASSSGLDDQSTEEGS